MAMKYLGETIDIHCGGIDHIPTHHPNEIAQAEAATGKEFVRYWMHAAFITLNGRKMSKSLGNYVTARELIDRHGGLVVRMGLISGHYRSAVDWNPDVIENAKKNIERIQNSLSLIKDSHGGTKTNLNQAIDKVVKEFEEAMDDDFNSPKALAAIHEFITQLNSSLDNKKEILEKARETLLNLLNVFGLDFTTKKGIDDEKISELMGLIINIRENARKEKNFALSDQIRERLRAVGIQIEDTESGPRWKIV
jgi:cysteinyl-tRNA synthetase